MKIIFYDVEHGSCCHIITPNNKHILVDIGSKANNSISYYIKNKYFRYYDDVIGNYTIDALIITHPHEDHIFDLPNLKSILPPIVINRPKGAFDITPQINTQKHIDIANTANEMNKNYNVPVNPDESPFNPNVNGGVDIKIISPNNKWTNKQDLNTFSSIIIVKAFGYKFVLTGDNPADILQKMLDSNFENIKEQIINADVLLAPHHGRTGEYCEDFFNLVNPKLTVVSDKSIEYGTQYETAQLYKGRGAKVNGLTRYVLTTRNDKTIEFDLSENGVNIVTGQEEY